MYEDSENLNSEAKQKLEIQFWIETKHAPCLRDLKAIKKGLNLKETPVEKCFHKIYQKSNSQRELGELTSESTAISSPQKFKKIYSSVRPETVPNIKNAASTVRKTNPNTKCKSKLAEQITKKRVLSNQKNLVSKDDKSPTKQGVCSDNDLIEKISNKNAIKRKLLPVSKSKPIEIYEDKLNKTLSTEDSPKKIGTKTSQKKNFSDNKGKNIKDGKANEPTKKKFIQKLTSKLGGNGFDFDLSKLDIKTNGKSSCFGNRKKQMDYVISENSSDSSNSKIKQPISNNFPVFMPKLSA